jgi:peroxiredoxin
MKEYITNILVILFLVAAVRAEDPDEFWEIRGKVVDEQGQSVEEFDAARKWSSNGKNWDDTGKFFQIASEADIAKFWKDEGVIAVRPQNLAKRLRGGEFRLKVDNDRASIVAIDRARRRGGLVVVDKSESGKPVTITLVPLVRVTGKIYCPEIKSTPGWTAVTVHPPGDRDNCLHFTHCGSVKGEFSFLLPHGPYDLAVTSSSPETCLPRLTYRDSKKGNAEPLLFGGIHINVPVGQAALDLGVVNVVLAKNKDGVAGDYSRFYGKEPPALAITDARGMAKDAKLADFRGKWVLLYFWSMSCVPCTYRELPALAKLCEEHAAQRDRFEILAICNAEDEQDKSFQAFDRLTASFAKAWGNKPLPFPVLIDGDGKTFAAYGVHSVPVALLIGPDGNLVQGGIAEAMLAEKLKAKKP